MVAAVVAQAFTPAWQGGSLARTRAASRGGRAGRRIGRAKKTRFREAWQIAATGTKDYISRDGIRVAPALTLLRTLV